MRKFIRHPSDMPIEYSLGDVVAHEREYLKDIGHGGLCFCSRVCLKKGSLIHIRIPLRNPVFEVDGVVAWCRKGDYGYDVGVSFGTDKIEFGVRMTEQACHIEHYKKEILKKDGRDLSGEEAAVEWIAKNAADFPS